jgi:hypothetical protein
MKVVSYTALHYGTDYLYWAIRSVIEHVNEHHILYSPNGSHGSRTDHPCPDSRGELISKAHRAAGDKLRWHDGFWTQEGEQRDSINQYAPDADVILVVDSDEVWGDGLAQCAIAQYSEAGLIGCRTWRAPIIHYWRSFYRCVLHDPAYPTRVIFPKVKHTWGLDSYINAFGPKQVINHMGYAQRSEIVEYKQHVHGHRGEWRKDDWFNTVFMANAQTNCHPVGSEYWNPELVNPLDYMPPWMKDHPYFNLEVIP